jgi:hypothetical protein
MFLYRPPVQGKAVSLLADQGLGSTLVVVTYTREECEASADPGAGQPDLVEEVQQAAVDHCDATGEPTRFQLVWFNADNRQIKSSPHSAAPSEKPKDGLEPGRAMHSGEPVSAGRIVSELLNALERKDFALDRKDKVLNTSVGVVLLAYEKALTMQQKTIDTMAKLIEELSGEAAKATRKGLAAPERTAEEISAEVRTQELKQAALGKLIELGPDLLQLGIKVAMQGRDGGGGGLQ